jgi:hypothetical protein
MELRLGGGAHSARLMVVLCLSAAMAMGLFATAATAKPSAHGNVVKIVKPHLRANAAQSTNWYGYNQGALEQGSKLFNSISGDWIVPTATQHSTGKSESSSTWIGIGGGCIDAGCNVGDNTLIQTGTEQDVDSSGKASYSAWWELIPAPGLTISNLPVSPGDHMSATIAEAVPNSNVWTITLKNVTQNKTFTTTVPYTSTHATAEWIQETPIVIGTDGTGLAALPNLTTIPFTAAKTNGAPAGLKSSEEIQLIDSNNRVIGAPSAPNATADGFSLCSWATSC